MNSGPPSPPERKGMIYREKDLTQKAGLPALHPRKKKGDEKGTLSVRKISGLRARNTAPDGRRP